MNFFSKNEELFESRSENETLVRENILLKKELELLRERIKVLEADEREIRLSLLRRSGILPSAQEIDTKEREFKPIKKTVLPWSQQAAKLEADSKERYWKKQIELRERTQEQRKADPNPNSEPNQSQEQIDYEKDIEELSR
jgi:hypothetical protein